MAPRERLNEGGGNYFAAPKAGIEFIGSGCKTLDLALGGGWAEDRVANIVGDKSSGKTLLCIEAAANFIRKYSKAWVRYREAEAAFDKPYAGALGMPLSRVDFGEPMNTVEEFYNDLTAVAKGAKVPQLYILDSLDALSDEAEMERDIDKGSFGTGKAKKMSELFRKLVREIQASHLTLLIVSQVRDKIGFTGYGPKTTRTGGRALDFYASQVLSLTQIKTIPRTIRGVKRTVALEVRGKVTKNKVSLPLREAEFQISFGYGIDDMDACLSWLREVKHLKDIGLTDANVIKYYEGLATMPDDEYRAEVQQIHEAVEKRWYAIEQDFLPTRRKYK